MNNWNYVDVATSSNLNLYEGGLLWANPSRNGEKYTTNSDTLYVVIEEQYNHSVTELTDWRVTTGGYGDIEEDMGTDHAGYMTAAQVLKDDEGKAQLVYIWKFNPEYRYRDITVTVNGEDYNIDYAPIWYENNDVNVSATIEAFEAEAAQTTVTDYRYTYTYTVDGKTITPENNAVFVNAAGEYIAIITDSYEDVLIEIVTDVVAEGDVYDINGAITVTYDGDKPAVEQAIKQIMDTYLPGKGLHSIEVTRLWENLYRFTGVNVNGQYQTYTWNAVADFVPGVDVTVNEKPVTVAEDADLAEAFAVAKDENGIEGHVVLNGTTMVGYVANDGTGNTSATVVDGGVYTDRNIRLTVGGTDYYGLADTTVDPAAVTGMSLDAKWVRVGTEYVDKDLLTYDQLDLDDNYTATAPTTSYWKITVDKKAPQYKQNGESVDFTGAESNYALRDSDKLIISTSGVTATADEEYTTGYHRLDGSAEAQSNLNKFPTATIKWYDANGELPKGASGDSFALNGDYYAVVTIGDGFTAGNADTLKIAGTNRIVISDSLAGVVSVNGGDAAQVDFTKTAVIEDGTITFYGKVNNADVIVTLTATHQ